jgi:hypothetical protein
LWFVSQYILQAFPISLIYLSEGLDWGFRISENQTLIPEASKPLIQWLNVYCVPWLDRVVSGFTTCGM